MNTDIPRNWLRPHTKAGTDEVRRLNKRNDEAIHELQQIATALEFTEKAEDLSSLQLKLTIAKQGVMLRHTLKAIKETQTALKSFDNSVL
jgi:hypothetical protein